MKSVVWLWQAIISAPPSQSFFASFKFTALNPCPPVSGAGTLAAKPGIENPTININDRIIICVFLSITSLLSPSMLLFFE